VWAKHENLKVPLHNNAGGGTGQCPTYSDYNLKPASPGKAADSGRSARRRRHLDLYLA